MSKYGEEAKQRWGDTCAYCEYENKTKGYTEDKWDKINEGMNALLQGFALCKKSGDTPESEKAQGLVKTLQDHITANYYTCTNDILRGLGQIYVADERFLKNIDKNGQGTAEFISRAIEIYCE